MQYLKVQLLNMNLINMKEPNQHDIIENKNQNTETPILLTIKATRKLILKGKHEGPELGLKLFQGSKDCIHLSCLINGLSIKDKELPIKDTR